MPIQDLNHVNINAPMSLLKQVRDFYVDILGLRDGWRPDVPVAGYWLYAGEKPVMHLMDAAGVELGGVEGKTPQPGAIGHLDHIAFTCNDVEAMEGKLHGLKVAYLRRDFPAANTIQLVVKDPTGMDVELNFSQ